MKKFEKVFKRPFIPIVTERLFMRPVCVEDLDRIVQLLNNFNVSKTLSSVPFPYTIDDARKFIAAKMKEMYEDNSAVVLSILDRKSGQLMGKIGYNSDRLGYWLGEQYWGQGFVKEALHTFVHFLFNVCHLDEIKVSAMPSNKASVRLIEGINAVPTIREEIYCTAIQKMEIIQSYKLTREDYVKRFDPSEKLPTVWLSAVAILNNKKLLLTQSNHSEFTSGLWEFPSVRIEPDQTPEQTLKRKLNDVYRLDVHAENLKPLTFASYRYKQFQVIICLYTLTNLDKQIDDSNVKWINYQDLGRYPVPEAEAELFFKLYDSMHSTGIWE